MLMIALLCALLLLIVLGLPTWPYSSRWTYYPSATLGVITLSIVLLVIAGRL